MHPLSMPSQVSIHTSELLERAAAHRRVAPLRAARGARRLRRRAGWWLVGLGLKLAVEHTPQVKTA